MKTCDEMVRDLLARRDRYAAEQKRRRAAVLHTTAALSCVCLMVLAGIGIRRVGRGGVPPDQTTGGTVAPGTVGTGTAAPATSRQGDTTAPPAPVITDRIRLIEAEEFPAPTEMMFALMGKDFTAMDTEALNAYYGVNVFPAVPDDLQQEEHVLGIYRREGGTGEVYWDGNAISYANADGSRYVSVNVDKDMLPFDFCNLFADVNERSAIGQTEVGLAQNAGGELYAEFMVEGVGFRLVAGGLTLDEVVEMIRSLLE